MIGKTEGLCREKARGRWAPSGREVGFSRLSQWPWKSHGFYSSSTMSVSFVTSALPPLYTLQGGLLPSDVNMPISQRLQA